MSKLDTKTSITKNYSPNKKLDEANLLLKELHLEEEKQITTTEKTTTKKSYADNESELNKNLGKSLDLELESIKTEIKDEKSIKAQAAKTIKIQKQQNSESNENILNHTSIYTYKPHIQSGYAVSKTNLIKINSKKTVPDQKLIAQQYLLEQIKDGWPYNEKYYRSDGKLILIFFKLPY